MSNPKAKFNWGRPSIGRITNIILVLTTANYFQHSQFQFHKLREQKTKIAGVSIANAGSGISPLNWHI